MAKVKVLVLYPTGFTGLGIDPMPLGSEVVELDEAVAATVVAHNWAEYVKPKAVKKTETAAVRLKAGS